MLLEFMEVNKTPCLVVNNLNPITAESIFGLRKLAYKTIYIAPAYKPFIDITLADFRTIFKDDLKLSNNLQKFLDKNKVYTPKYVSKPFQHQMEGTEYCLDLLRAGALYDPGLGKSKIIIDVINTLREKTLILSPLIGLYNTWEKEIQIHGDNLPFSIYHGTPKSKKKAIEKFRDDGLILLTTYETAKKDLQVILELNYAIIIADESHKMRSIKSGISKTALKLSEKAYRRIISSGTPTLGDPRHIYCQLKFLSPVLVPDYHVFKLNYLIFKEARGKTFPVGFKNLNVLNEKVNLVCKRKTKEECIDLPERTITDIHVELSSDQNKTYKDLSLNIPTMGLNISNILVALRKMHETCGGTLKNNNKLPICDTCIHVQDCVRNEIKPYTQQCKIETKAPIPTINIFKKNPKLDALLELLDMILIDPKHKVIIFANYVAELDLIEEKTKQYGIQRLSKFMVKGYNLDFRILLGQISQGQSFTFNEAQYMIIFSCSLDLKDYLQAIDRNYRIGQTQNTTIYRIIAKDTIDEKIFEAIEKKQEISEYIVNSTINVGKSIQRPTLV